MAVVGALITAASGFFATAGIGAAIGSAINSLLTSVALSALSRALGPKRGGAREAGLRTTSTMAGGTSPEGFILGWYATEGQLVCPPMSHGTVDKTPNAYLTYVIELGGIAGQGLDGLIIDGEPVTLGGTAHADYGLPVQGRFDGAAWIKYYDGTQVAADPMLLAKYGTYPERPWTSNHIGAGLCYAILTFKRDPEIFSGYPKVRFVMTGIPLYDPRKDSTAGGSGAQRWGNKSTWSTSENPMVQAYNILRGITLPGGHVWGGEAAAADLSYAQWAAAMNDCDEISDGAARYRSGFEVLVEDEPYGVIEELLTACGGQLAEMGGEWLPAVGKPPLPVMFITDDDVIATEADEFTPFGPPDETYNAVSATFPRPSSVWEASEIVPIYFPLLEAEDGGRRLVASLALNACPYAKQVRRVAREAVKDSRRWRRHVISLPPEAAALQPLDTINWTSARNGYIAKRFEVVEVARDPQGASVQVVLRERDPSDYDFEAEDLPSVPSPKPVRPAAQAVPGWSVTATTMRDGSGNARKPALLFAWNTDAAEDARGIKWELRRVGETEVDLRGSTHDVDVGSLRVAQGILPSTSYQARARLVLRKRQTAWSSWLSVTTGDVRLRKVDLADDVTDYMSETALLAGIKPVGTLPAAGDKIDQIVMKVPEGVLYRWDGTSWTRTLFGGIKPGDVDIASFAASIRPTELFAVLPTTGNFNGRIVYRTSDKSLWRHDGTSWINTNAADQIVGELIAGQIAAGAITARELAVDSVAVRHLVVTDWTNIAPNGAFNDVADVSDYWGAANNSGNRYYLARTTSASFCQTGENSLLLQKPVGNPTASVFTQGLEYFPVAEGEWLYGETAIRTNDPAMPNGAFIRVFFYTETGAATTPVYVDIAANVPITNAWVKHSKEFQVPVGAVKARLGVYNISTSTSVNLIVDRIIVKRMNGGELTIDGSLKARHMAAEVIISNVAQLGVAVVTTAAIGDLQVDTLNIKGNAVTTTAYATKAGSVAVAISASGSGGVPSTSSGGPLLDITVNRTAGLVTEIVWSGILSPNTTDYSKFSTFRLFVRRNGVQILKTQVTSDSLFDSFRSLTIVDTNTGGGSTLYEVEWASDYQVNNVTCNVKSQTLKATQFKK